MSWLNSLHGYLNTIYQNLGTFLHAELMGWREINLLNKVGLKMNLAFLISFMIFHFYLNLAFHANVSTIRLLIVLYLNFFGPHISTSYTAGTLSKESLTTYFFNFNLFLTWFL